MQKSNLTRSRVAMAFVAMCALGAPMASAQPASPKPAKHEPLPAGALRRLGAVGIGTNDGTTYAVLSRDGKYFATAGFGALRIFERATGACTARLREPSEGGGAHVLTFSPTGRVLASASLRELVLREIPSGKVLHTIPLPGTDLWTPYGLSFSADGKRVAVGIHHAGLKGNAKAVVCDATTGKSLATFDLPQNFNAWVALSPDGKRLATGGNYLRNVAGDDPDAGRTVQLWDIASAKEARRIKINTSARGTAAAAFTPSGSKVGVIGLLFRGDVRFFDAESGAEKGRLSSRHGWAKALQFSPDGRLLLAGDLMGTVQAWHTDSGKEAKLAPQPKGCKVSFGFPGKNEVIALGFVGQTLVWWDVFTGKTSRTSPGHVNSVLGLAFTADGKTLRSLDRDGTVISWNAKTGNVLREMRLDRTTALSHDARIGVTSSADSDDAIQLRNLATGQKVREINPDQTRGRYALALAANGTRLVRVGKPNTVEVWDTNAGGQPKQIRIDAPRKELFNGPPSLACAPDGTRIAVGVPARRGPDRRCTRVMVLEVAAGKQLWSAEVMDVPETGGRYRFHLVFSRDGKLLAFPSDDEHVMVVRSDTGKEERRLTIGKHAGTVTALAFSPDGRVLAVACGGDTHFDADLRPEGHTPTHVDLCELAGGERRTQFSGHVGPVASLAFSPDGATIASGGADTTVFLWDAGGTHGQPLLKLAAKEVEAAWAELARPDAKAAFQAQCRLIRSPVETVRFLQTKLKPAKLPAVDAKQVQGWVANLDSNDFAVRARAHEALDRLGLAVEPYLRKARAGNTSLETRRRIDQLVAKLDSRGLSREEIRALRAIEVLERIAASEARTLVQSLAGGTPSLRVTRDAAATAVRMRR